MVSQTISHYKILEKLGGGGMGVVYKAEDTKLKRLVALKFLPPDLTRDDEAKERFVNEAQAASALDHPNICTIYEIDEDEVGRMFIAMAYYEGETLQKKVASNQLSVSSVIEIASQIATGLAKAHEHGITHRDIKPANVMITKDGVAKILDFGLAKLAGRAKLTKTGSTMGTAAYMSPEQARGEEVDHRTDIWALGVVLYEMITGQLPFRGEYEQAVVYSILCEEPKPIRELHSNVPMQIEQIVCKAMAKIPGERYQHADDLLADLKKLKKDLELGTAISTAKRPITETKSAWRQPAYLLIAVMAAIILALSALWLLKRGGKAPVVGAQENSIAVMYFENLTGDSSLDWIEAGMVEMLTANLGRFENLNVLSSQRLFDIMRQVSGEEATRIDRRIATQIAEKAGVRTMLLGSVLGTLGQMRLNTQLVEVPTGKLVGSEVLDTGPHGSLFSVVDSLTQRIVVHLKVRPPNRPVKTNVAYTLTNSPEALRHYVEGIQALYRSQHVRAVEQFKAAVGADSTFAMAYFHLAIAQGWYIDKGEREALEKARQYGYKVSERERALIEASLLEDLGERKKTFEQLIERYPDEKFAWYKLGDVLYHNYWPRASVKAFHRATELDPNFLLAYIHILDFYFHIDQYDKAETLNVKVLALDSSSIDFQLNRAFLNFIRSKREQTRDDLVQQLRRVVNDSTLGLADRLNAESVLAMMEKELKKAETAIETFRKKERHETLWYRLMTNSLAGLALLQGKYEKAERYLREAGERRPNSASQAYEEGLFLLLRGRTEAARKNAQKINTLYTSGAEPFAEVATLGKHLLFLATLAEGHAEKAREVVLELEKLTVGQENEYGFLYHDALGRLACYRGEMEAAQRHFMQALSTVSFTVVDVVILFRKLILDGLLECLEKAGAYETLLQRAEEASPFVYHSHDFNTSTTAVWNRNMLRKGRAYEALGQIRKAIEVYEEFLNYWQDADKNLPELLDTKARLAKLKGMNAK